MAERTYSANGKRRPDASERPENANDMPRKVTRRLARPERRRLILEAAARLIAAHGVGALTIERVANEVGVTKPIIYDHFLNVSSLVYALLDEGFPNAEDGTDEIMGSDLPMADRFRQVAHLAFDALSNDPALLYVVATPLGDPELEQHRLDQRRVRVARWASWWSAELGVSNEFAEALVSMLLSAVEDAGRQFVNGTADRQLLEPLVADLVTALVAVSLTGPRNAKG